MHVLEFPLIAGESSQRLKMPRIRSCNVPGNLAVDEEDDFSVVYCSKFAEPFEDGSRRSGWSAATSFYSSVQNEMENRVMFRAMDSASKLALFKQLMSERKRY